MPEFTASLPPGYSTVLTAAVIDILASDETIRQLGGGGQVPGLGSITPGTTTLTSDTPNLEDLVMPGDLLYLGDQLVGVDAVVDPSTLELVAPHVDGMAAEPIYRAGRIYRERGPFVPAQVMLPCWVVWSELSDSEPTVGRREAGSPAVVVAFHAESAPQPLGMLEGTAIDALHLVQSIMTASIGAVLTLCVPRFGRIALVRGDVRTSPLVAGLEDEGQKEYVAAPAIQLSWTGLDPVDTTNSALPARWT